MGWWKTPEKRNARSITSGKPSTYKVLEKLPIKPDVMKTTGNPPSQVDSALKEGPAQDHHLTRELKGANKGLKLYQAHGTAFFEGG